MSSDLRGFVVDQFICYDWVLPLSGPATIKVLSIKKFLALGDIYFYPPPPVDGVVAGVLPLAVVGAE